MKKKIGITGLKNTEINYLNRKYKKFIFQNINDKNFFSKKNRDITALIILFEYPVQKTLNSFFTKRFRVFHNLKWLHLSRAGIDELIPYLKEYKFKISCGKKIQAPQVSEHCMSLLLGISRCLFNNDDTFKFKPIEIKSKKLLIVGMGGIGQEISKLSNSFGLKVYSVSKRQNKIKNIINSFNIKHLAKIVNKFDIVINALPLTNLTKNIFNKEIFKKMKKNSIFICISRSQTVNKNHLMKYIKKKFFFGVGIDNTGNFPIKKNVFFNKKYNFIITNHQGGKTDNILRKKELSFQNINNFSRGKKIKNLVSKKLEY